MGLFEECFGAVIPVLPGRRGRRPRAPLVKVLSGLVFHFMSSAGTLAAHFAQLFPEDSLAESSLSERRTRLPWEVFTELMRLGLRSLAKAGAHPDAFWRGWRLVALDGTQFSLTNTPQIKATVRKAKSRRGRAAFAKITASVLLELGLHNPLAAAIGLGRKSEWALGLDLVAQLPARSLLLADRLYGCPAFLALAMAACQKVGSHFLIRARNEIGGKVLKTFKDGSRLVRLAVRQKNRPNVITQWLEVREIRVRVQRKGHRAQVLRLWTSLKDPRSAPALELIQLYTRRWEQELYYRELKRQLRKNEVLQSHTLETGAQEIAAIILASALLARERARAAGGQTPPLRVSFLQTLELMRPLWLTLALGGEILSARQKQQLTDKFLECAGRSVTIRRKRPRSCPRAVRQPVSGWPRLRRNQSWEGPLRYKLL
jgi:Transposase DDE domain